MPVSLQDEPAVHAPRRRGLRRALGLVRRCGDEPPSPERTKKPRAGDASPRTSKSTADVSPRSPSRLSSSSLSSSFTTSSQCGSDKSSTISLSRKGVMYDGDGAVVCCRFCDILRDRDADFIYEDEQVAVFRPLSPAADSHVLVVPRCHIRNINKLTAEDTELLKHMRDVAQLVLCSESSARASDLECKFAFHTPPFNSIDHVHMHAFRVTNGRTFRCLGSIKYRTDTWWCQSFDVVLSRVADKTPSVHSFSRNNRQHVLMGGPSSTK